MRFKIVCHTPVLLAALQKQLEQYINTPMKTHKTNVRLWMKMHTCTFAVRQITDCSIFAFEDKLHLDGFLSLSTRAWFIHRLRCLSSLMIFWCADLENLLYISWCSLLLACTLCTSSTVACAFSVAVRFFKRKQQVLQQKRVIISY